MAGTRLQIVVGFLVALIAFAPFAYHLNQVERYELPNERIDHLTRNTLHFTQPEQYSIAIHTFNDNIMDLTNAFTSLPFKFSYINHNSKNHLNGISIQELSQSTLEEIDKKLLEVVTVSKDVKDFPFHIFFLCQIQKTKKDKVGHYTVGIHRHAWSLECLPNDQSSPTYKEITTLLQEHIFPEYQSTRNVITSNKARLASKYRLQFTLMKEHPNMSWRWNFEELAAKYLVLLLEKLSKVAEFTIESRVVNYGYLSKQIKQGASNDSKNNLPYSYIEIDDLRQFNSLNDFLTSSVLSNGEQALHFTAALPILEHEPLYIREDSSSNNRLSQAFEIPGWGGVVILNTKRLETQRDEELARVMGLFITQLRTLFGLPSFYRREKQTREQFSFLISPADGMSDWELDSLIRNRWASYQKKNIDTLLSIKRLVDEMPQMTVNKHVQTGISDAVALLEEIQVSKTSMSIQTLLAKAQEAANLLDAVDFDHTMIRQIHFPQEQLLGVYAPLLGPLIVPVLMGFVREVKRWNSKRKAVS